MSIATLPISRFAGVDPLSGDDDLAPETSPDLIALKTAPPDSRGELPGALLEPLESFTTAELLAHRAPPQWLLPGLLYRGQPTVIVGPSRCQKTSLAIDLCGALAGGGTFLGQFAVPQPVRVGFVGGAGARDAVTEQARRWSATAEVDLPALDRLVWAFNLTDLRDPANLSRLREWIALQQLEAVLIDAADLGTLSRRGETEQLQTLVNCCLDAGAMPILCCQTRHELPPRAMTAADLATAPCSAIARQWLLVNRREEYRPGSGSHRLWLTVGGNCGHSGEWGVDIQEELADDQSAGRWQATVRDAASIETEMALAAAAAQSARLRQKLRIVLTQIDPHDATKLKIRERSGMSGARFGFAWDELMRRGEIALTTPPDYRTPHREPRYRLLEPGEIVSPELLPCRPLESLDTATLLGLPTSNPPANDRPEKNSPQSSPLAASIDDLDDDALLRLLEETLQSKQAQFSLAATEKKESRSSPLVEPAETPELTANRPPEKTGRPVQSLAKSRRQRLKRKRQRR